MVSQDFAVSFSEPVCGLAGGVRGKSQLLADLVVGGPVAAAGECLPQDLELLGVTSGREFGPQLLHDALQQLQRPFPLKQSFRCSAVGRFQLSPPRLTRFPVQGQDQLTTAAFLSAVVFDGIDKKIPDGSKQEAAEEPSFWGRLGNGVVFKQVSEETLRGISGGVFISATSADIDVHRRPVSFAEHGQSVGGSWFVLSRAQDDAPLRRGERSAGIGGRRLEGKHRSSLGLSMERRKALAGRAGWQHLTTFGSVWHRNLGPAVVLTQVAGA